MGRPCSSRGSSWTGFSSAKVLLGGSFTAKAAIGWKVRSPEIPFMQREKNLCLRDPHAVIILLVVDVWIGESALNKL